MRREGRDQPRLPAPHAGLPTSATRTTAQCFRRPRRPPAGFRRDAPLPSPPPPLRRAPPPRLRLLTWPGRGGRARGRGSRGSRGSRAAAVQRRPSVRPSVRRGWRVSRGRVGGGGGRGEAAPQRGAGEGWGRGAGAQPCLTQPAADFRRRCRRLCPDQNTHTHVHTRTHVLPPPPRHGPHAACASGSPARHVTPFLSPPPPPFVSSSRPPPPRAGSAAVTKATRGGPRNPSIPSPSPPLPATIATCQPARRPLGEARGGLGVPAGPRHREGERGAFPRPLPPSGSLTVFCSRANPEERVVSAEVAGQRGGSFVRLTRRVSRTSRFSSMPRRRVSGSHQASPVPVL